VTHEQVPHRLTSQVIDERPFRPSCAQVDDLLQRGHRVVVQWDDSFLVGFAARQAQPPGPVGVAVQTVHRQMTDLVATRPGPASNEQGRTLERAGYFLDDGHQPIQFVVRDEPRHLRRRSGCVAGAEQGVPRDVVPVPGRGVAEELSQAGDALDP